MSSSKLVPFEFDGKGVHVFEFNGQTWFIARDVGKALGICNIRDLIREILTEDERMYVSKYYDETLRTWSVEPLVGISDKSRKRCTNPVAISESGLYTVIMRSSKPQAVKFRKWVTSEVLPALRERGHYEMPSVWPQTRKQKPQAEQKASQNHAEGLTLSITFHRKKEVVTLILPNDEPCRNLVRSLFRS